jgi:TatD DNase family protein
VPFFISSILFFLNIPPGVITYSTNPNTSAVIKNMFTSNPTAPLRILLETDPPYMFPANIYNDIPDLKGKRLPLCPTALILRTAEFVASVTTGGQWDADRVMREARENARKVYGI